MTLRNAAIVIAGLLVTAGTLMFSIDLGLVVAGVLLGAFVLLSE